MMITNSRIMIVVALALSAGLAFSGCNTFRGAGKDIQRGGEAIENAAEEAQN